MYLSALCMCHVLIGFPSHVSRFLIGLFLSCDPDCHVAFDPCRVLNVLTSVW